MRHRRHRHHLGRTEGHRNALLSNLATALFRAERVRTTLAKAKALRPYAEPIITLAKTDTLHHRRLVLQLIQDKEIVRKLFTEIGPRVGDRPGGYLRIVQTAPRPGDAAPMAYIELVDKPVVAEVEAPKEEKKSFLQRITGR